MGVGVQGGHTGYKAKDGGHRLGVRSMGQGVGCENVAQIMKANLIISRVLQQCVKPPADCRGNKWRVFFLGEGNYHLEFTLVLSSANTLRSGQ